MRLWANRRKSRDDEKLGLGFWSARQLCARELSETAKALPLDRKDWYD
jgi:hypothetical protein